MSCAPQLNCLVRGGSVERRKAMHSTFQFCGQTNSYYPHQVTGGCAEEQEVRVNSVDLLSLSIAPELLRSVLKSSAPLLFKSSAHHSLPASLWSRAGLGADGQGFQGAEETRSLGP